MEKLTGGRRIGWHGVVLTGMLLSRLGAQPAPDNTEFFEKKIRPVLVERCYACHGPAANPPKASLRLDSAEGWRKGGERGPEITPGEPESSRLIQAIRYQNPDLQMPPTGRLPLDQIADFEAWVKMGAPDPRTGASGAPASGGKRAINLAQARRHWAYQPPKDRPLPSVRNESWVRTPIDRFILAKLEEKHLQPAPQADRATLVRRVTFDLIGLPPTQEEVDGFVEDKSPDAYQKVVERLLASPHYGERWARHWLDLVRYAETDGHEFDVDKPNAWRYRDYVIRAFNDDLPYKQFVTEQIAGDLRGQHRVAAEIDQPAVGTGFYWLGEIKNGAVDSNESIADRVDNQIDVIGKTFLGLTVACARCHDHKFDPIPTADYYSLAGFLHSSRLRQVDVDPPEQSARVNALMAEIERLKHSPDPTPSDIEKTFDAKYQVYDDFSDASRPNWFMTGPAFRIAGGMLTSGAVSDTLEGIALSRPFVVEKQFIHVLMRGAGEVRFVVDEYKDKSRRLKAGANWQWKTLEAKMTIGRSAYFEVVDFNRNGHLEVDAIVQSSEEKPPVALPPDVIAQPVSDMIAALEAQIPPSEFAMSTLDSDPRNVHINIRGSYKNPGAEAPRRFLTILAGDTQPPITQGSGRLELAQRITADSNPLLARVMVNRIWLHHFGQGIVATPDNFGLTGDPPSHPELLDFLALEFARGGWSIKNMHRIMVLSNTYQMSSRPDAAADGADPQNKLLHRMPVRRLEAEAIHDSILAVAGTLNPAVYGPGVPPYITPYMDGDPRGKPASGPLDNYGRRSIYVQVRRNYLADFLVTFDYPPPISTIGRRNVSAVPSQALFLMNNEFVTSQAQRWAERILLSAATPKGRVERMYWEAFGRAPRPEETAEALSFAAKLEARYAGIAGAESPERRAWTDLAHVLFNTTEFVFIR